MKIALSTLVGIPIMLGSSSLYAQPDMFAKFAKATRLYSCHYFIKASAESSSEMSQREKLQRISNTLLMQAATIALDTGGQSLKERYRVKVKPTSISS
jgi:23S rRNA G2445 N2-methylase RlmL